MKLAYWVTFQSSGPAINEDMPHPPGFPIAEKILEGLNRRKVAGAVENWRDVGWSIDCVIGGKKARLFFSTLPNVENGWILCCSSGVGAIGRLLRGDDGQAQFALAQLVSEILKEDKQFSGVRWYPKGWRALGNEEWTTEPRGDEVPETLRD